MTQRDLSKPTRGQLERRLSQQIQKLYREHLGHATGKVSCQLRNHHLTVIIESALTQPEQLLLEESEDERVEQLRSDLDKAVRPKLVQIIEEVLQCQVVDLMSDTTLATERTSFVAVLEALPGGDLSNSEGISPSENISKVS